MKAWFDKAIAWATYNAECEEVTALVTETKRLRSELEASKKTVVSKALALTRAELAARQADAKFIHSEIQREREMTKYLREIFRLEAETKRYRVLAYVAIILGACALALSIIVNWSNL
jgi:hypothetical protein